MGMRPEERTELLTLHCELSKPPPPRGFLLCVTDVTRRTLSALTQPAPRSPS